MTADSQPASCYLYNDPNGSNMTTMAEEERTAGNKVEMLHYRH